MTNEAAALLAIIHGYDKRGTRGDGQKAMEELESNNPRVTNDTFRALSQIQPWSQTWTRAITSCRQAAIVAGSP